MVGRQLREFYMPWFALAFAVVSLAAAALVAAPVALAGAPATDQYGSALPGVGGGGGDESTSGSSSGSGAEATIPVAGESSSSGETAADTAAAGGSDESSGANAGSSGGADKAAGSSHGDADKGQAAANDDSAASVVGSENTSHSVPQIAADSAGDGWVPFFIAGLVALGAAGALLIYRNWRRTAQG
jgi:hypothetical protein